MTREIPLTRGLVTLVDDDDYEPLSQHKWHAVACGKRQQYFYARRGLASGRVMFLMHRVILNAEAGAVVDHINGDTLDNRRANLRVCSYQENSRNAVYVRPGRDTPQGVCRRGAKFGAYINLVISGQRKNVWLGTFPTADAAHAERIAAEIRHFGQFSPLMRSLNDVA